MIFFFLVLSLILILVSWLYSKRAAVLPGIPRLPGATFFLGNFSLLMKNKDRFHYHMVDTYRAIGKTFYLSSPMFPPLVVLAPNEEIIKYILKENFYNYIKSVSGIGRLRELLGHGIFASDGNTWRIKRKIVSHMFSKKNLREMANVFRKDGYRVIDMLKKNVGKTIDAQKLFYSYTFSSFSEIAFGKDPAANSIYTEAPFAQSFDQIQTLMSDRSRDQFWKLKRYFQIGERERGITKHAKLIDDYAYGKVKEMKKLSEHKKNSDLISRFLVFAKENSEKMKGVMLTDEYLRDLLINFMLAGRDTTASTLTWLFFELDQNPDVAEKMTEEVHRVLSDGGLDKLTCEAADELTYVEAAIYETLRLHPSVPFDTKQSINPDILPDGTKIPGGTILMYSPWIFGRSKELWGETVDVFRPERWFNTKKPSEYRFISFNAGYRLCLGKELAKLEAKILIAMILYSDLSLQLKPDHDISIQRSVTLRMKHGLSVIVKNSKYASSDGPTPHRNPQLNPL